MASFTVTGGRRPPLHFLKCDLCRLEVRNPRSVESAMTLRIFMLLTGTAAALLAAEPAPLAEGAVVEEWPHFLGPHFNATTREGPLLD